MLGFGRLFGSLTYRKAESGRRKAASCSGNARTARGWGARVLLEPHCVQGRDYETNPIPVKPAWKSCDDEAKNEPNLAGWRVRRGRGGARKRVFCQTNPNSTDRNCGRMWLGCNRVRICDGRNFGGFVLFFGALFEPNLWGIERFYRARTGFVLAACRSEECGGGRQTCGHQGLHQPRRAGHPAHCDGSRPAD
jgi:hypothetical protein